MIFISIWFLHAYKPYSKESSSLKNDDSKNVSKTVSVLSANGEVSPSSTEPNEPKLEGSAGSGQNDSGFRSEGISDYRKALTVND